MAKHPVTSELDDLADQVQALSKRYPRHAKRLLALSANLDTVSNELDTQATRTARTAASDPDLESGAWGPEDVYQDSYEASDYHKAPVGSDSLAKAIDKNPADILADLDFAQSTSGKDKHRILVQADRQRPNGRQARTKWPFGDLTPVELVGFARRGEWEKVRRAASMVLNSTATNNGAGRTSAKIEADDDMDVDIGTFGAEDRLSTADLGESGDESIAKPNDADQEGGTLQFYGTYAQKSNDTGPDSGHHRRDVAPPNRETRGDIRAGRSSRARSIIERMADRQVKPEVKDPDDLLNDEPGDNVERDQPLGGLSGQYRGRKSSSRNGRTNGNGSRESEVKVYRPVHVPREMHGLWHRAAQRIASEGRLLDVGGEVDYYAIDDKYRGALKLYRNRAASASRGRTASRVAYRETPRQVRLARPDFVPMELLPYWNGAAEYQGKKNRLVTASGKVDYEGVNRSYCKLLDRIASIPAD
jgi:hypothetical protein